MRRPIVSLADALRCQAELDTRGEATADMLRLLGLDILADTSERDPDDLRDDAGRLATGARRESTPSELSARVGESRRNASAAAVAETDAANPAHEAQAAQTGGLPTRLRRLPPVRLAPADGMSRASALPAAATATRPPDPDPLFATTQRRAILTAAITTFVREGRLDVDTIVQSTVSARPMRALPRLLRGTVRRGAQVLVDRSEAMAPYWRDQDQLIAQLRELLGRGHLEVFTFRGFPVPFDRTRESASVDDLDENGLADIAEAPRAAAPSAARWRPPRSGTPVVIVSDFGIGARIDGEEWVPLSRWLQFADEVRALGCNIVGLIPYDSRRWPAGLPTRIACIPWSERTTAGAVRRTIRRRWGKVP